MKKILSAVLIFCVSLLTIGSYVNADYGTGHILNGKFKNAENGLTYWYDSSVSTYSMTGHFDHAIQNWDALSSKVSLSKQSSASGANIKIYVGNNNLPSGYAGMTNMYSYNWLGQVIEHSTTDVIHGTNFEQAVVRIDNAQRQNMGFTNWGKMVKLAGHEVGHTLSMHHFENSPSHNTTDWMYSSNKTNSAYPSAQDKSHFVHKWGK